MADHKLTIVQILPELEEGGVEGETLDLAIYLARTGHRSIVISGGGRLVPQLERGGCIHIFWPHVGEKSFRCLQYIFALKKLLLDEKVDILHLRSRLPAWIGYLAWTLTPIPQRPSLISTFHGFYSINLYSSIMTKGERVVAVSKTIERHILENYKIDGKKISLIHGGFDDQEFSPEAVSPERIKRLRDKWLDGYEDTPIIALPGRFTTWKGQDVFIDSLAQIKNLDFVALIIGCTEENQSFTKKLQDRIRGYGLEDKILLAGHCDDMPAALLLVDLVVSASSLQPEAFGKVAIEAMAMAKPVIATAHGGSLETVVPGVNGWLVPPLDPRAMGIAIARILTDLTKARKLGQQGQKWVSEHFTATTMCEKTFALYTDVYKARLKKIKPKSLTVMQLLPELHSGGVERGTLELGRYLARNGHKSIVVSGGGRLVEQLEKEGSQHFVRTIGSKSLVALLHIWPLRRLIKKNRVQILHLRSRMPAWIGYIAWRSMAKRYRPILISTFHGFYSVNAYSAIMIKGDGVIAVSQSIAQHILEKYDRSHNVRMIFRGVEMETFDANRIGQARVERLYRAWNIDRTKTVLMLPGRLTRLKGQETFLESLLFLNNQHYQAIVVGDTEENPSYAAELTDFIEKHKLTKKVFLVGHCHDMAAGLLIADIVLSTSSLEPEAFGRTTVEAMAMEKPVIATAHGGSLETVVSGLTGWLVRPSDPKELAVAIDEALAMDQKQLQSFGKRGRFRVLENFTARTTCKKTLEFYQDLYRKKH